MLCMKEDFEFLVSNIYTSTSFIKIIHVILCGEYLIY